MQFGYCLSAILVAGALTVSGSWAKDAVPAAKNTASPPTNAGGGQKSLPDAGAAHNASGGQKSLPDGGARGSAPEGGAGPGGKADTTGAKDKAGGNAPIDTRITVQPNRAVKKSPFGSEKKAISPAAPSSANSAGQIIPHERSGPARNAIGVPQGHGTPAADGGAKNAARALGANGSVGGAGVVRPGSVPITAGSTPHNRAVITGTGMNRLGSGPATLGGAAKNVTAVNGTNIRRKQ